MTEYSENQWTKETRLVSLGRCLRCPDCKTLGFYGPRTNGQRRRYRALKFCGFWQEAGGCVSLERGGEAYRCVHVYCDKCGTYDWRFPWQRDWGSCTGDCGNANLRQIKWAAEDPAHPFNEMKRRIEQGV